MSIAESKTSGMALALRAEALGPGIDERRETDARDEDSRPLRRAQLDDEVSGLREWATDRTFLLDAPRGSYRADLVATTALRLSREALAPVANRIELSYEAQAWRVRDWDGIADLKQDGVPTREARLLPGVEVTIAGRTFLAESTRTIALREFCARLMGWGEDRLAAIDETMRAIRSASSGRAALLLRGEGDLVPIAHAIHRRACGEEAPFIVSDPRRKNTAASVRSAMNCVSGVDAVSKARGGTLCVRAARLPRDFPEVISALRSPGHAVQLNVCARRSTAIARDALALGVAVIEIPPLATRWFDIPRIVHEYVDDALDRLQASETCLQAGDLAWIIARAVQDTTTTIADIEKAALRVVAVRQAVNLSRAAALLGMAPVSLERWLQRREDRGGEPPRSPESGMCLQPGKESSGE